MGKNQHLLKDRTGESLVMRNGLTAKITVYRNCKDIDITFETGKIVRNIFYGDFAKRKIRCPMLAEPTDDYLRITNFNTNPYTIFFVDKEFEELATKYYWYTSTSGYATHNELGKLHRLIVNAKENEFVDHINMNKMVIELII